MGRKGSEMDLYPFMLGFHPNKGWPDRALHGGGTFSAFAPAFAEVFNSNMGFKSRNPFGMERSGCVGFRMFSKLVLIISRILKGKEIESLKAMGETSLPIGVGR